MLLHREHMSCRIFATEELVRLPVLSAVRSYVRYPTMLGRLQLRAGALSHAPSHSSSSAEKTGRLWRPDEVHLHSLSARGGERFRGALSAPPKNRFLPCRYSPRRYEFADSMVMIVGLDLAGTINTVISD